MATKEARARAVSNYLKKFDEIRIRVPKGDKIRYQTAATKSGKSLNSFFIDCAENQIKSTTPEK